MFELKENNATEFFSAKSVLITGACGTIGKNLAKELLKLKIGKLRLFDVDDSKLTELKDEFENYNERIRYLLGNIRDKTRLVRAFENIDFVFHCAALKHVEIGEYNPREVIRTNINGTENVIEASLINNVKGVIFTSSDKAVNPVNTMGASKLLGEKLIVAAGYIKGSNVTRFSAVRFGNVLGSRGSIIPRFKKRMEKGLKLIVTDPKTTRFMMPIQNAVDLTIKAMINSVGGEIFVLKMPTLLLGDLVDLFLEYAWMKTGNKLCVEFRGLFPGEKNYEELMTKEEISRVVETEKMYIILPHIDELRRTFPKDMLKYSGKIHTRIYNSHLSSSMSKEDLKEILEKYEVFAQS